MSFLTKLFGGNKPGTSAPARSMSQPGVSGSSSIAALLLQQKAPMSPERCGSCSTTFMNAQWNFTLVTEQPSGFQLDVGGYCPRCSAYRCPQHARMQIVDRSSMMKAPDPSLMPMMWGMTCSSCGTALQPAPGTPVKDHALLVDGRILTEAQPKPKQEYASSSGRLSIIKIIQKQHHLDPFPNRCDLCGATYQHMPKSIGLTLVDGLGPEKFDVDVGGCCSEGCGSICPKHVRMGQYSYHGQKLMMLLCDRHGTPVTPTPGPLV